MRQDVHGGAGPQPRPDRGFTLIELMMSVAIFSVVSLAAFSVLSASQKSASMGDQTTQIQRNVRLALDLLARDFRLAGYGNPAAGAMAGCAQQLNATDNAAGADAGPDSIAMMTVDSQVGTLTAAFLAGGNTITVTNLSSDIATDLGLGQTVYITLEGFFTARVTAVAGTALTLASSLPSAVVVPTNTPVLRLACVTYTVTDKGGQVGGAGTVYAPFQLLRNAVPTVDGIEDMQLAYGLDTDGDGRIDDQAGGVANVADCLDFVPNNGPCTNGTTVYTSGTGTQTTLPTGVNASPSLVRQVRITIVGRAVPPQVGNTPNNCWDDESFRGTAGVTVQAEDHLLTVPSFPAGCARAGQTAGIRRRVLTRIVTLRNETS